MNETDNRFLSARSLQWLEWNNSQWEEALYNIRDQGLLLFFVSDPETAQLNHKSYFFQK